VSERQLLRDKCLNALSNYVRQAQRTCDLLGDIEGNALSLGRLLAILVQTQAEDEAQQSYIALRQRLFNVLQCTPGASLCVDKAANSQDHCVGYFGRGNPDWPGDDLLRLGLTAQLRQRTAGR
jgi:hypothetical protein